VHLAATTMTVVLDLISDPKGLLRKTVDGECQPQRERQNDPVPHDAISFISPAVNL
jgi:hypothetical protein